MIASVTALLDLAEKLAADLDDQPLAEWKADLEHEREVQAADDPDPLVVRQLADAVSLLGALQAYRLTSRPIVARLQGDRDGRTREDL